MSDAAVLRPNLAEPLRALGACNNTPDDAVPWARAYEANWELALADCPDPGWLIWLAVRLMDRNHLSREAIVLCVCACARTALPWVHTGEARPLTTIETTERWARGEATRQEVEGASSGAWYARVGGVGGVSLATSWASASAYWAACAALADTAHAVFGRAVWAIESAVRMGSDATVLGIIRRDLGPALIEGLEAYSVALPGASR